MHEVKLDASGVYVSCAKVMDLKGHKSQARSIPPRACCVSGRGTLQLLWACWLRQRIKGDMPVMHNMC